jgi:signal transduction histidine kinase
MLERVTRARLTGVLLAIWSVPATLLVIGSIVFDGTPLTTALAREGGPWLIWVVMTPSVVARASAGALRGRRLAAHIARAIAIGLVFGMVSGVIAYVFRTLPRPRSFSGEVVMGISDWAPMQVVIYPGVAAVGLAIDNARRRRAAELGRAQLEAQLAYAQLAALRAQLQPHFLFNTLNAAVALARAGDADGTARVLVLLGDLLRQLLRADAPQEIPLREELGLLETYLEIQRVRFGDRLHVHWAIADDVRDALVPQLVLQPLVENALQHGIARRTRAGRLDIAAARHGDQLRLQVTDDGPGVAASFSLAAATGLGLRNTRDRLHRLYGARGALALTSHDARTTAAIELPIHVEAVRHG